MTQPTDVYSVYDASGSTGVGKGNREDLVNVVYDISPTDTPLLSALPRTRAKAVLHEWTTHALTQAAANERVEGDDIAIDAAVAKTRLNNRTAISAKVAGVTKTQQAVSKVGMQDAMAEEVGYKSAEIKRDMEVMLFANTAKVAGNDTTARKSAGLPTWITNAATVIGANPTGDGSDSFTFYGDGAVFQKPVILQAGAGTNSIRFGPDGDGRLDFLKQVNVVSLSATNDLIELRVSRFLGGLDGALGAESEAGPTVLREPLALHDGDAVLLCTDGFWGRIDAPRIEERLRFSTNVDEWLEAMRREVAERVRGGDDNSSAVGDWIGSPAEVTVSKSARSRAKQVAS
jgi:hypothetical protein